MSIGSLSRRVSHLDQARRAIADLPTALDAARERLKAWRAAGNVGHRPFEPLPPAATNASRRERELREAILAGRARVAAARAAS